MSASGREHIWAVHHGTQRRFSMTGMTIPRHRVCKHWVAVMGRRLELRCTRGERGEPPGLSVPRMRDLGSPGCTRLHGETMQDAAACAARH